MPRHTPDGRYVYVANEGMDENPDNRASLIETATDMLTISPVPSFNHHRLFHA